MFGKCTDSLNREIPSKECRNFTFNLKSFLVEYISLEVCGIPKIIMKICDSG